MPLPWTFINVAGAEAQGTDFWYASERAYQLVKHAIIHYIIAVFVYL